MTTTLVLTPLPDLAAVRILALGAPDPDAALPITRTDANGSRLVRQKPGQITSGGELILVDYEPALTGPVVYSSIEGATATTTLAGLVAGPVVASIVRPARRAQAELLQDYAETYAGHTIALQVIDRDDAIPLLGPAARRNGEAGLLVDTYAQAQSLVDAVTIGTVVLFRQLDYPGMDAYGIVTSTRVAPTLAELDVPKWLVTIGYLAVPSPDVDLAAGAAWTYADLAALGVTYGELSALFLHYRDLAVGA